MKDIKLKVRRKMTEEEKLERRERKRRYLLRAEITKLYTIVGFHRLFKYEDQAAQHILDLEVDAARIKAAVLERSL